MYACVTADELDKLSPETFSSNAQRSDSPSRISVAKISLKNYIFVTLFDEETGSKLSVTVTTPYGTYTNFFAGGKVERRAGYLGMCSNPCPG